MSRLPDARRCQEWAEQMLSYARTAGADAAEVLVRDGSELEVKVRMGEPELVKDAGSRALGLRVLRDHRVAVTYTSDFAPAAMRQFARQSVELCELAEPDPLADLPEPHEMARDVPELDLWDETAPSLDAAQALRLAKQGEQAALQFDRRVTNSEGGICSRVMGATAFASSAGFSGGYRGTSLSLVVAPVCDDADGKKRNGYHWTASRFTSGLLDPEAVGQEAARRTLAKLGSRKIATCQVPAVFAPEAARALLGQLAGVVSGGAVGTAIASALVTVVDDPLRPRAPGSRPFDGEGLAARPNVVVSQGVLRTFLCDVYSARKLGRRSTGSAGRGLGGGPHVSASNFVLLAGKTPPAELERLSQGLYVTDLMGFGFNPVTGDWSQGANGFWIDNGSRAHPVSEVTISINFDDLWKSIDGVGNDLDTRGSVQSPTLRVSRITVAGT
jgi:PmbA protein